MGVIKYTTAKINELLEKTDKAPEKIENGKTPVFVTGTTVTLDPGFSATSDVIRDGVDESGNPKYKINFGIPKGLDGAGGGSGGVADSIQWSNVLNKPSWVNQPTKPIYTASEVGALPAETIIPSKISELTNDSSFLVSADFKTINGESIVGEGNIQIEGGSSGGGGNLNVTNINDLVTADIYTFKPSADKSTTGTLNRLGSATSKVAGLMSAYDKERVDSFPNICVFDEGIMALTNSSTKNDIVNMLNQIETNLDLTQDNVLFYSIALIASTCSHKDSMERHTYKFYINRMECIACGNYDETKNEATFELTYPIGNGKLKTTSIFGGVKIVEEVEQYTFKCTVSETGDDEYYLPEDIFNITATSTSDEIINAFGGADKFANALSSIEKAKKVYLYNFIKKMPVSVYNLADIFIELSYIDPLDDTMHTIALTKTGTNSKQVIYLYPYRLKSDIVKLTNSSTSDEISTAVEGEYGMKDIINAMKEKRDFQIEMEVGESASGNSVYNISYYGYMENVNGVTGDMQIVLSCSGFGFAGSYLGGVLIIEFTKSTNTFQYRNISAAVQ